MRIASLLVVATLGCSETASTPQMPEPTPAPIAVPHQIAKPIALPVPPPLTLTAADGSGLRLTRIDAKAVVEGPLAFTELHLYFHNPEDRIREGTFAITLPTGAAVSRFAMHDGTRWQEAEVVEKAVARLVYEDFLHRKQDPALLEKAPGNQFVARVFPIPARGDKHLVISYSQPLAGRAYTLPLRGLPQVERIDVQLAATEPDGTRHTDTLDERDWQPDRDFVATTRTATGAIGAGELIAGSIEIGEGVTVRDEDVPTELTLLVDTSASRALDFTSYVKSIRALVGSLGEHYGAINLQVIAFDQDTQRIFAGPASEYGEAQDAALLARGAAGASDLGQALEVLAQSPLRPHGRVAIVTDGVMTAGLETPALVASIGKLPIDRLDVIVTGGLRDERLASSLARAARQRAGDVYDLDLGIEAVATGLAEPVYVDIAIDVPGASWFYPHTIPSARAHSSVMVYAHMPQPASAVVVRAGDTKRSLAVGTSTPALIERAIASAEIDELDSRLESTRDAAAAKAMRADIAKRSVKARLISSQASMLVLETEEDYARYHIPRTALADILVVGPRGLEQMHRSEIVASKQKAKPPAPEEVLVKPEGGYRSIMANAMMSGNASMSGVAYGAASARGYMSAHVASMPTVSIGQPMSVGSLNKDFIRRYIRLAVPRVRYCYERELLGRPTLAGTVTVQFFIASTGKVTSATASGFDATVARCVADVIKTVEFPSSQSQIQVNYPFTFQTPESVERNRREAEAEAEAAAAAAAAAATPSPPPAAAAPAAPQVSANATAATPAAPPVSVNATAATPAATPVAKAAPATVVVSDADAIPAPRSAAPDRATPRAATSAAPSTDEPRSAPPLTGKLAKVMRALARHKLDEAHAIAKTWHADEPGDVLALVALGEVLEARGDAGTAARMYGSIIDLFPARADLRRFAGERLERLGDRSRKLVIDTYRKAVADRPDHVSGHRLLAYALVRADDYAGAFAAILAGVDRKYPDGRFAGADRVLAEDAGMIAAAYLANGGNRAEIVQALTKRKLALIQQPSTRFIMYWETDANDVDFHIRDRSGGHAFYQQQSLPSGGELYADVTTGYGPECFAIQGTPKAAPYRLSINYFSKGPMGYGMGLLEVQRFDGKRFTFDERPYVIMTDHSFVELGSFR